MGCRYDVDFVLIAAYTLEVHAKAVRKVVGPYRSLLKTESGRHHLPGDWTVRPQNASGPPVSPQRIQGDGEQHALYWELSAPTTLAELPRGQHGEAEARAVLALEHLS